MMILEIFITLPVLFQRQVDVLQGFQKGKGYSESRYDGWVYGDGHYNYLSISFDNIDASSASGTWGLPFDNSYGTLTATRVGAVPIPGAIPLFSSGLLGLIWLRKKNK